jgi:hypothetical protein
MRIVHVVDGATDIEALRRAIELSATKYCTVTGNLSSGVTEIHHAYLVRDAAGEEHYGTVVVTGPAKSPDHWVREQPRKAPERCPRSTPAA